MKHTLIPVSTENFPFGQPVHSNAPILEYVAIEQFWHELDVLDPKTVEYFPAVQSTQVDAPETVENVPLGQFVQ